jgi:regulator of RNase E activity RraA
MSEIELLNEYSTSEISDALDYLGIESCLLGIKPLATGTKIVGKAYTVKYRRYDEKQSQFSSAGNYIDDVPEGHVIVIDNEGITDCTVWGDILTRVALLKNIKGTVVNGAIRDVETIRSLKYPIYSKSNYMRSGKNRVYKQSSQCQLTINHVDIHPNDIIVADDNGVVVVPQDVCDKVVSFIRNIRSTEEFIVAAVAAGMRLEDARKKYRYDQPWLSSREKG